jgi:hypothetical protein
MPEDPNAAGGTDGGAETPAAASSPTSDQELLSSLESGTAQTPDPNAEVWDRFRNGELDLSKAPEDVRAKAEAPFLSISGKKVQEAEQQRKLYETVIEKLTAGSGNGHPQQPTIDQRALLKEKIAEGDLSAVDSLVEEIVNQRVGPQMAMLARENAVKAAVSFMPELPKYETQVAAEIQQDPELLYLATVNDNRFAPKILAGLGWRANALELRAENAKLKTDIAAQVKAGIAAEIARIRGLPPATSQGGRAPTAHTTEKPMTLDEIRETAWKEAGGS